MVAKAVFKAFLLCATLFLSTAAFAQAPTPYHPGDTLSFKVRFEGADAGKLVNAQLYFRLTSAIHGDQQAFNTQIGVNQSKTISPGEFEVSIVIPRYMATGTYQLFQLNAGAGDVGFVYQNGLPSLIVNVDSHERLERPELKGITETSKP